MKVEIDFKEFKGALLALDGMQKAVLAEYKGYIAADPKLTDDTKRIRTQTADKCQEFTDNLIGLKIC